MKVQELKIGQIVEISCGCMYPKQYGQVEAVGPGGAVLAMLVSYNALGIELLDGPSTENGIGWKLASPRMADYAIEAAKDGPVLLNASDADTYNCN